MNKEKLGMYETYKDKIEKEAIEYIEGELKLATENNDGKPAKVAINNQWLVELVLWGARMMDESYSWHAAEVVKKMKSVNWDDDDEVLNYLDELQESYKQLVQKDTSDIENIFENINKNED